MRLFRELFELLTEDYPLGSKGRWGLCAACPRDLIGRTDHVLVLKSVSLTFCSPAAPA